MKLPMAGYACLGLCDGRVLLSWHGPFAFLPLGFGGWDGFPGS